MKGQSILRNPRQELYLRTVYAESKPGFTSDARSYSLRDCAQLSAQYSLLTWNSILFEEKPTVKLLKNFLTIYKIQTSNVLKNGVFWDVSS
jgi:hypothetical protein